MRVLKTYEEIFTTKKPYILLKSGRLAGKTYAVSQKIMTKFIEEDGDIIVFRSNLSDIKQSIMQEILNRFQEEDLYDIIETRSRPIMIINKLNDNVIYFLGIGGSDIHRTKGFQAHKKVSLVVGEELQQVPGIGHLKEATATFVRSFKENTQSIYMFNPPRLASHWMNEYFRLKQYDDDYLCLHTSYQDIARELPPQALREILLEKKINPSNYKWQFLGLTEGLFGAVYSSFNREKHLVSEETIRKLIKKVGVHQLLIGVDPASTIDSTAFIPYLLLKNGQGIVLNYFYHDPKQYGHINNHRLSPIIKRWLEEDILDRWGLSRYHRVDMVFDTNAVSNDLRNQLAYLLDTNFALQGYSQKNVIEMADIVQNALGRNAVLILDEGGYFEYSTRNFVYGKHPLVQQLEQVIWNEDGSGFEKKIPNDCTDALTYVLAFIYKNPANLHFPDIGYFYEQVKVSEEGEVYYNDRKRRTS